uniref:Caspase domain-containing protein n=1 Tax=uncultured bacterium EC5 TaxID=672206 RepID=G4WV85_9BACT|nr:caspase domain-containing protein [uncultured bacterium EC5]
MDDKALVIGIDDYPELSKLKCCVNDATAVTQLLERHEDGTKSFDVERLTSPPTGITNEVLSDAISSFFKSSTHIRTAVLYFAGHGIISTETDAGYILGTDARKGNWGVSLSELLALANDANGRIHSTVIILDCCHAGTAGEMSGLKGTGASLIGPGVTILTSCNEGERAKEGHGHGVFTNLLLDGLRGGCADIRGNITPAALYSHIDQSLGAKAQRPLYKANVQRFVTLRQVEPKIPHKVLQNLPKHFPDPAELFPLDPSYEPDRKNVSAAIKRMPVNPEHTKIFEELQMYNRQGLVVPVGAVPNHMFFAAIQSKACGLTALGRHYWRLAAEDKI